jgi:Tfp pilus assembly protein PilX
MEGRFIAEESEILPHSLYKRIRIGELPKEFFEKIQEYKSDEIEEKKYALMNGEVKRYYRMTVRGISRNHDGNVVIDTIFESEFFE